MRTEITFRTCRSALILVASLLWTLSSIPSLAFAQALEAVNQLSQRSVHDLRPLAEQGDVNAEEAIGLKYVYAQGTIWSPKRGIAWLRKAARSGSADAACALGMVYGGGPTPAGPTLPSEYGKSVKWYERAAKQGWCWLQLAQAYGNKAGADADKHHILAYRRDLRSEAHWWRQEAEPRSSYPTDYPYAKFPHGNPRAQLQMALLYEQGTGVHKSYARARVWLQRAAQQGYRDAFDAIGTLYMHGLGVPKNTELAYVYFGLDPAFGMEQEVGKELTRSQLAQAEAIINQWHPGAPLPGATGGFPSNAGAVRQPPKRSNQPAPRMSMGPSLCARLASRMRHSPVKAARSLVTPDAPRHPWIVFATPGQADGRAVMRHLYPKWERDSGGIGMSNLESLPNTDLYLVTRVEGSADCSLETFVRWRTGGTRHLIEGPLVQGPCSRQDQSGGLAMVLGHPAYVESEPLEPWNKGTVLHIAPWVHNGWGQECHVASQFRYAYPVQQRYCGADQAACRAAQKVAPAVQGRYDAYSAQQNEDFNEIGTFSMRGFRFQGTLGAKGRALVDRARDIAMARIAIAESHGAPAWVRTVVSGDVSFFPLRLDHKLYVASITTGGSLLRWILPDAKRYLDGNGPISVQASVLMVYQAPGAHSRQLIPVAAFTVETRTIGVTSIRFGDD